MRGMGEARDRIWNAGWKRLGIEDMVWLVFGVFVVECGEELFCELEFAHVAFPALFFQTP
jgi:hypothetical protein